MLQSTDGSAGLDLTRPNHHNALASVLDLFIPDRGKEHTVTEHYITWRQQGKTNIPLQNTDKEIQRSFTTLNYIPREPTYSLGSWGAQDSPV
jgi:hypothetical protein